MTKEQVLKKFEEARLPVKVECINPRWPEIFQLDIQRGVVNQMRMEVFRIWFGKDVEAQVTGIDKKVKQLVLFVKEPERTYERRESFSDSRPLPADAKVISEEKTRYGRHVTYLTKTPKAARHYLLGLDERQFFIAEIKRGNSVKEAHRYLKAAEVTMAEGRFHTVRQGEFFFRCLSEDEKTELLEHIIEHPEHVYTSEPVVEENRNIRGRSYRHGHFAGGGTPHLADQLVRIPRWSEGDVTDGNQRVRPRAVDFFVKGFVRSPRHKSVRFRDWMKVIRNTEVRAPAGLWID